MWPQANYKEVPASESQWLRRCSGLCFSYSVCLGVWQWQCLGSDSHLANRPSHGCFLWTICCFLLLASAWSLNLTSLWLSSLAHPWHPEPKTDSLALCLSCKAVKILGRKPNCKKLHLKKSTYHLPVLISLASEWLPLGCLNGGGPGP